MLTVFEMVLDTFIKQGSEAKVLTEQSVSIPLELYQMFERKLPEIQST